jgi:hypothetical protein
MRRAYLRLSEKGPFTDFLWKHLDGRVVQNSLPHPRAGAGRDRRLQGDLEGAQGRGLHLLRPDHRLCGDAGLRHGQRPPHRLLPLAGVRGARPRHAPSRLMAKPACPAARLAAHAVGPAPRPARSLAARHRDRPTSHMALPASRAGTARPAATIPSRWRSIRLWSRRSSASSTGLPPDERLMALLHDAPEYVIGDMISPFKAVIGGGYKTRGTAPGGGRASALRPCRRRRRRS